MTPGELEAINAGLAYQVAQANLDVLLTEKGIKQNEVDGLTGKIQVARDVVRDAKLRFKAAAVGI